MLVFEEYVELFRKKVANLEKDSSPKRRKSRPSKEEDEFDLVLDGEDDSKVISELGVSPSSDPIFSTGGEI